MKSYVIESLLADGKSENFDVIYSKSLTAYRNHTPGSWAYKTGYLRNELPINIYNQVVDTRHRPNMNALQNFIRGHEILVYFV